MSRKRWFERDHFSAAEREVRPYAERLAWCPPNLITLLGLILAVPAAAAFIAGWRWTGLALFVASLATDLVDGPVARLQDERMTDAERAAEAKKSRWLAKGKTAFGTAFDPFVDKARYFPALIPLGLDCLWHPLIWTGLAFATLLTLLRWGRFRRLVAWTMTFLAGMRAPKVAPPSDKTPASNKIGKYKVHAEAALICLLVLLPRDPVSIVLFHALLIATTLGGLSSLIGQLMTIRSESKAPA